MGMVGMEERAVLLGGRLDVFSDAQHGGTIVTATVPVG
jgi:signal transduction histidine kinase